MIDGVTNSDGIGVLERLMQFAGQRHRLIATNIANLSTPNYRPLDVSVTDFQKQLGEAIDRQRQTELEPVSPDELPIESTSQVEVSPVGLTLHPQPAGDNLLFHDGNDRSLEHQMKDLVENFMTFRFAAEAIRNRFDIINTAIRGRV